MLTPLMPKATAVWLIENTVLTFGQIANFCGLHTLEIEAIADTDPTLQMGGLDPIASGQLSIEEVRRCEQNPTAQLRIKEAVSVESILGQKRSKYTPIAKRKDRPDAIVWLLKYCPLLNDRQISRLIGTTKPMIETIRGRKHWNIQNIRPKNPIQLGLCTQSDLERELAIAKRKTEEQEENVS